MNKPKEKKRIHGPPMLDNAATGVRKEHLEAGGGAMKMRKLKMLEHALV